eukprot:1148044-Pelagomonas_calceolata.AAC.5
MASAPVVAGSLAPGAQPFCGNPVGFLQITDVVPCFLGVLQNEGACRSSLLTWICDCSTNFNAILRPRAIDRKGALSA